MATIAVTAVLALILSGSAGTAPAPAGDTIPLRQDTLHLDDTLPPLDTAAAARIVFDFGGGAGPAMRARSLEVGVSTAPNPYVRNQPVATTRVRFVRRPDSLSAGFARLVSSSERIPLVEVEIRPATGAAPIIVQLHEVQVVSTRLTATGDDAALRQQRLALVETVEQVRADLAEGERQLTVTASLEKRHLASPVELARARDSATLLRARLAVQEQRLSLVQRQLSDWMPFEEEVVLASPRMDAAIRTAAP